MYSFTRFFPAQIPSSRASSSVRQSISLISMAEGNVMKPNFSPYASHSTNFRSARLTSVFTLVSPCSARCRRRSSASFSIRTDLVTLAFPGMNRPCLTHPSTSFFVFLDVLLHSFRRSATHDNEPEPVQNIRLLTLAAPLRRGEGRWRSGLPRGSRTVGQSLRRFDRGSVGRSSDNRFRSPGRGRPFVRVRTEAGSSGVPDLSSTNASRVGTWLPEAYGHGVLWSCSRPSMRRWLWGRSSNESRWNL